MSADPAGEGDAAARWADPLWRLAYRVAHRCLRAWWLLRRPEARGVGIAVWRNGRLLVVRTSYRGALLGLPGGGVEPGEDPRSAAVRELREEVGLEITPAALREAARIELDFEHRRIEETVFELRPPAPTRPPRPDRREIVWTGWLTPADLESAPVAPNLRAYLATWEDRGGEDGPAPPRPGSDRGTG